MSTFHLRQAAGVINAGGVVAYPTEAVFGLGCNPLDAAAVTRLLRLKQRSLEQGLIVIAAGLDQAEALTGPLSSDAAARLSDTEGPPTTWVVPAHPDTPYWLTGGRDTLAVRLTRHPLARALCLATGSAVVSTSANLNGKTMARDALGVRLRFGEQLDYILNGRCGRLNQPTEIRNLMDNRVIRVGAGA